ncbi:FAD-dependent oxidoreductase [Patescibacteria group bacterium]|nr:FAD-dependent oxidoreductase [Patescibacteria group bacterium]MBU1663438.1 FAD-dependent oxidoreductase [Patescibacteria group bacterium]MBU1933638.1 FAD-dependent oxidoreductase [Patescibacteria group bacterium]MBU2007780.1 FAD-dependent oxidoreductase [Patescibacteria group bacterium]MBU2233785.1 FAD-dependent oxidoreductase [Patescibacteria group bacterium]
MFDTIIIGAGPAGMTAAIYACRRMMKVLVISKNIGGQVIWASDIKNYPGMEFVRGVDLISKMSQQMKDLGVDLKTDQVKKISKNHDGSFLVEAGKDSYLAKTIIIAIGLEPKQLKIDRENELTGKGISYCANCDGPLFKGKSVAVVGGGNAALDAVEVMSKIAGKVYLIYRKPQLKAFGSLILAVESKSNVEIILNSEISEIIGREKLEKVKIINNVSQISRKLDIAGLFVEIGHEPKTGAVADLVKTDTLGQVVVDLSGKTSCDGIFAAGDVTQSEFKQIVIGCGQGAIAALSAYKYIQLKNS